MKILALVIGIMNAQTQKVIIIDIVSELQSVSFFSRGSVKDSFQFVVRESLTGLQKGTRHTVSHEQSLVHIKLDNKDQLGAYLFTDQDYPKRIAFGVLSEALQIVRNRFPNREYQNFISDQSQNIQELKELFKRAQQPTELDKVLKAQQGVNELEVIMHDNLRKLLDRQGDLDKLVAKSEDLSAGAKAFYKTSKKMDKRCCNIF